MKRFLQHLCKISRKIDWMTVKRAKKLSKLIIYIHQIKARTFSFGNDEKKVLRIAFIEQLVLEIRKNSENPNFSRKTDLRDL